MSTTKLSNDTLWFPDSLSQRVDSLVSTPGQIGARVVTANLHPHDGLLLDTNGRMWFTLQDAFTLTEWLVSSVKEGSGRGACLVEKIDEQCSIFAKILADSRK